jgi:hypothetical protein
MPTRSGIARPFSPNRAILGLELSAIDGPPPAAAPQQPFESYSRRSALPSL